MSHIHTQPGQHDLTVSAYIVRRVGGEWACLVHMHKKLHKLLQIGGHVELDETPWQALAREVMEEAGYELSALRLLVPNSVAFTSGHHVVHPLPVSINTHKFSDSHYHTDLAYAFEAVAEPTGVLGEGESHDIRWLTLGDMEQAVEAQEIVLDVAETYLRIIELCLSTYQTVPASTFSLAHPSVTPA